MSRIETTAIFEGLDQLRLDKPVDHLIRGPVKVVVIYDDADLPDPPPRIPTPDFAAMRREILGPDAGRRALSPEESTFVRDRGER